MPSVEKIEHCFLLSCAPLKVTDGCYENRRAGGNNPLNYFHDRLLPTPAFRERRHRGLARGGIAARRRGLRLIRPLAQGRVLRDLPNRHLVLAQRAFREGPSTQIHWNGTC